MRKYTPRKWLRRVAKIGPGCWEWTGFRDRDGYGRCSLVVGDKREQMAPRVSFIRCRGDIPPGMVVMHECDNPACVRPSHLSLGLQLDNIRDMIGKGRHGPAVGEANHFARISADDVVDIRSLRAFGATVDDLALEFELAPITVSQIVRRVSWRSVP